MRKVKRLRRAKQLLFCFFPLVGAACSPAAPHQDLVDFIADTHSNAKKTPTIFALPANYQPLDFAPSVAKNPFVLANTQQLKTTQNCWQPEALPAEDLFVDIALADLLLKGVIQEEDNAWALVSAPDNTVARVSLGQVLGTHLGRVDSISHNTVLVTEHLPDGLGCWQQRHVKLALHH